MEGSVQQSKIDIETSQAQAQQHLNYLTRLISGDINSVQKI